MIPGDTLREVIGLTQAAFRACIGQAGVIDVGFIGNTSGVYPWEPALIVDIDVCLFVARKDSTLGHQLQTVCAPLRATLDAMQVDFELKVLRGPYKPAAWRLIRPVAIAHLAIFTEASYTQEPAAMRWSWRKYRCVAEPERLLKSVQEPPLWNELHEMASRKLARIRAERIQMTEWELPDFVEQVREFDSSHPVFAEYCLAGPLVCARAHARILRRPEADQLGNREFAAWYQRELLDTTALQDLVSLKDRARQAGYEGLMPGVRNLGARYLEQLVEAVAPRLASSTPPKR